MIRSAARFCSLLVLLALLLSLAPSVYATAPDRPHVMPPHPRLWPEIEAGRLIPGDRILGLPGDDSVRSPTVPHPRIGALKALAVLVQFSDKAHTVTASYFDHLIFDAEVSGRGSVNDYYNEVSYGQVDIVAVTLPSAIGWKTAPQTLSYYTNGQDCTDGVYPNNCRKLAEDVVDAINGVVDFSQYDNDGDGYTEPIMLVHAGPGAEFTGNHSDIWSHSWTLYNPRAVDGVTVRDYVIMPEFWETVSASTSDMTIGVFAHEMGHGFWGLPDLYDRDYSSQGVGRWSLMAGGSWNGPDNNGDSPAWPDAWSRAQMGFVTPTNIVANAAGRSIPQAYGVSGTGTILKMRTGALSSQEYFLLENRQQVAGSYDQYLPGAGLLIWHVDEAMNTYALQNDKECALSPHCNCSDTQHFLVALEQADGTHNLEISIAGGGNRGDTGDPFPGSTNNRSFAAATQPENSSWYSCSATNLRVENISNSGANMTADLFLTLPGLQPRAYIPMIIKSIYVPPPGTWTTIISEEFEGAFPANWILQGTHPWGKRNCRAFSGSFSGWPFGGSSMGCGANYPDYANSVMIFGPFSLAGATAADLRFKLWLSTETDFDFLCRYGSKDGVNFSGACTSGNSSGWIDRTLDLSNAGTLGSLLGEPNVWIALRFVSDVNNNYPEGAYVDSLSVRKCTSGTCPAVNAPSEEENGSGLFVETPSDALLPR